MLNYLDFGILIVYVLMIIKVGCGSAYFQKRKATPEEVRKNLLERCEIFSKDGGFIFNTSHSILSEVPADNILAA